jgi:hypothetical protein
LAYASQLASCKHHWTEFETSEALCCQVTPKYTICDLFTYGVDMESLNGCIPFLLSIFNSYCFFFVLYLVVSSGITFTSVFIKICVAFL